MNKLIKSLMIVSLSLNSMQILADDDLKIDTSKYNYPLKKTDIPFISYDEKDGYTIPQWLTSYDNNIRKNLNKEMREAMSEDWNLIYNINNEGSKMQTKILMNLYKAQWDYIQKNYPNEKNAISAFCLYGKYIGALNDKVKKCDKNFKLANEVLIAKMEDLNSVSKEKVKARKP